MGFFACWVSPGTSVQLYNPAPLHFTPPVGEQIISKHVIFGHAGFSKVIK